MIWDIFDRILRWIKQRQAQSYVRGGERAPPPALDVAKLKPRRYEPPRIMNTLVTDVLCYQGEPCFVSWDVEIVGSICVDSFKATLTIQHDNASNTFTNIHYLRCEYFKELNYCVCKGMARFELRLPLGEYHAIACSEIEGSKDCDPITIYVRELPESWGAPPPAPPTRPLPY
jgi:hypothetical protein